MWLTPWSTKHLPTGTLPATRAGPSFEHLQALAAVQQQDALLGPAQGLGQSRRGP